ncbi:MAG: hypothetical protein KAJ58_00830 [Candidatus Pacebacteria bacterium]|nr:hypothetical protein [Candidatus Paceibacterota bacterium]
MLKKIFKKQIFLILIAGILLVWLTQVNASSSSQLVSISDGGDIDRVGRETLEILLTLKALELDEEFFELLVFKELKDFSIELEDKAKGRNNPFKDFLFDDDEYEDLNDDLNDSLDDDFNEETE